LKEAESDWLAVEEGPTWNQDKSSKTMDKAPKETNRRQFESHKRHEREGGGGRGELMGKGRRKD
jgi:hypothetical protein